MVENESMTFGSDTLYLHSFLIIFEQKQCELAELGSLGMQNISEV